jgi:hypothetical protein
MSSGMADEAVSMESRSLASASIAADLSFGGLVFRQRQESTGVPLTAIPHEEKSGDCRTGRKHSQLLRKRSRHRAESRD